MSARRSDPASSGEAAALHSEGRERHRWKVLLAACQLGEFTDDLLMNKAGGERNVVAKRRGELVTKGYLELVVDRRGRPVKAVGRSGTKIIVHRVTEKGKAAMKKYLNERGIT